MTTGRPEYEPTAAARRRVTIGAGSGMSHEALARALKISRNTLEKHFAEELANGAAERQLELKEALYRQGKKGNVAAIRLYLQGATPPPSPTPDSLQVLPSQTMGVKAQRNEGAKTATQGTEWQDILPVHRAAELARDDR
jgi:hypothetical protein